MSPARCGNGGYDHLVGEMGRQTYDDGVNKEQKPFGISSLFSIFSCFQLFWAGRTASNSPISIGRHRGDAEFSRPSWTAADTCPIGDADDGFAVRLVG